MTENDNITDNFYVGDWAECGEGRGWPSYINITKDNVEKYNDPKLREKLTIKKVFNKDELRSAQKYFVDTLSLRLGDYLRFDGGKRQVVDRISELPHIEGDLTSIDSYVCDEGIGPFLKVRTETGYEIKYFDAVDNKISEVEAREFFGDQIKNLERDLELSKAQNEELKLRKFFD